MKDFDQYSDLAVFLAYALTLVLSGFFVTIGVIFALYVTGFRL